MGALAVALVVALPGCIAPGAPEPEWRDLVAPRGSLARASAAPGWVPAGFGGGGEIEEDGEGLVLHAGAPLTGVVWPIASMPSRALPHEDYELEVEAARLAGTDFFCALTFPVGGESLTLVLGGWGGSVCGFSCLAGRDAASNPTTSYRRFDKGVAVTARVRVTPDRVEAWLDGEPLCSTPRAGVPLSLRPEVEPCRPLGLATYATTARIRTLRWRPYRGGAETAAWNAEAGAILLTRCVRVGSSLACDKPGSRRPMLRSLWAARPRHETPSADAW